MHDFSEVHRVGERLAERSRMMAEVLAPLQPMFEHVQTVQDMFGEDQVTSMRRSHEIFAAHARQRATAQTSIAEILQATKVGSMRTMIEHARSVADTARHLRVENEPIMPLLVRSFTMPEIPNQNDRLEDMIDEAIERKLSAPKPSEDDAPLYDSDGVKRDIGFDTKR